MKNPTFHQNPPSKTPVSSSNVSLKKPTFLSLAPQQIDRNQSEKQRHGAAMEEKNGLKKKKFIVTAVTTQVFTVLKGVEDRCKQSDCVFNGEVDLFDDYCDECYGLEGYAVGRVRKDSVING